MKTMWCWRCRMEMPMLDEDEFALIAILYREAFKPTGKSHIGEGLSPEKLTIDDRFRPLREKYKELTGFDETNHLAILHHRIAIYGDPCANCGKPLRTPQAAFCAACGQTKNAGDGLP